VPVFCVEQGRWNGAKGFESGGAMGHVELRKTARFTRWLDELRDLQGRARIQARIERLAAGNPGDVAPVGEGVSELRVDVGPGYRVYFTRRGRTVIVLLAGGSKHTQAADIRAALQLARGLSE